VERSPASNTEQPPPGRSYCSVFLQTLFISKVPRGSRTHLSRPIVLKADRCPKPGTFAARSEARRECRTSNAERPIDVGNPLLSVRYSSERKPWDLNRAPPGGWSRTFARTCFRNRLLNQPVGFRMFSLTYRSNFTSER